MKYFIIHGDYEFELEIEEYETKQEAVNRIAFFKAMSELTVAYPYTPTPLSSKSMG